VRLPFAIAADDQQWLRSHLAVYLMTQQNGARERAKRVMTTLRAMCDEFEESPRMETSFILKVFDDSEGR
jgi:hypothetical protein